MVSWAALSDEQMRKIWPFCLLNDEQMSNKVGVKHQPVSKLGYFTYLGDVNNLLIGVISSIY